MKGFHISLSALVTLCLSLIHINVVLADEWDGIVCYEGLEAKKKMCSSCVTVYDDNSIIKRDCYESLTASEQQACESNSNVRCQHCIHDLCNEGHPKHQCITCDSTKDRNCMNNAISLETDQCVFDSKSLDDFYCYVRYDLNTGENKRGCVTTSQEYSQCIHDKDTCKLCIANGITNNGCQAAYPENRRKCIQCDSKFDKCPTKQQPDSANLHSVYCKTVDDSCAVISRDSSFVQTCVSDMSLLDKVYCTNNPNRCPYCSGNNCNLKETNSETTDPPVSPNPPITPTARPSEGHQFYGNHLLLAIFVIISIIIA